MAGHRPLAIADRDEAARRVAETLWTEPLEARNEFANGLLAWAEEDGHTTYEAMKRLLIDTEYAVSIEEWKRRDPTVDEQSALERLQSLMLEMVRAVVAPRAQDTNYHAFLGPDIPNIINEMFEKLYAESHNARGR